MMNGEPYMDARRNRMPEQFVQKAADVAAAGSVGLAGAAWIADVEPYISVGAGIVAIIAGLFAAWYHAERAIEARQRRTKGKK